MVRLNSVFPNHTNWLIDTIHIAPLAFWREHQVRFPVIAALTRDVLSFPATGAGVERLFNTARDIYHYRRGRMKSQMIEELTMFLCTSRFDIEEQEAKLLEKFFSHDEVEIDPISDTEEQDTTINNEIWPGKVGEADESQLPLPRNSTQVRVSGGKRKSRDDDLFEYH